MKYCIFDIETTGLNFFIDTIICIGYKLYDEKEGFSDTRVLWNDEGDRGQKLVFKFLEEMEREGVTHLVGFNILRFDVPFLLYKLATVSHPGEVFEYFTKEFEYVDLREILNKDKYAKGKLCDYLRAYNIENNDKFKGSDIPRFFKEGNLEPIREHITCDVESTAKLFEEVYLRGDIRFPVFKDKEVKV